MAKGGRRPWYYRLNNGKWVTTQELAALLKINPQTINGAYLLDMTHRISKRLGYVPIRTKNPPLEVKPKHYIVYKVNNKYKYGICFGRGFTKKEAIEDFKDSRKDSGYKHKILFVTKDYDEAKKYLGKLFEEENVCEK